MSWKLFRITFRISRMRITPQTWWHIVAFGRLFAVFRQYGLHNHRICCCCWSFSRVEKSTHGQSHDACRFARFVVYVCHTQNTCFHPCRFHCIPLEFQWNVEGWPTRVLTCPQKQAFFLIIAFFPKCNWTFSYTHWNVLNTS